MNHTSFTVDVNMSIIDAMKIMDKAAKKILFIQEGGKLKGVATDGDFRRWIVKSGDLTAPVLNAANKNPIYIKQSDIGPTDIKLSDVKLSNESAAERMMKQHRIDCIPIVDEQGFIVKALFRDQNGDQEYKNIGAPVVIMAGGQGNRLYPYTKVLPKPLIPIGNLTILERIANNFVKYGCTRFYLTLNYKKSIIKAYCNELDYDMEYVEEELPLGTGGSLFYLKNKISEPLFVSNCDILINADYYEMYRYHAENGNAITVVASLRNTVIPYGVIELGSDGLMKSTIEKPSYNHLINTGMYVIDPEVLTQLKKPEPIHMTDIIGNCIEQGKRVGVFPIGQDAWLDMGQVTEMENMIKELERRK